MVTTRRAQEAMALLLVAIVVAGAVGLVTLDNDAGAPLSGAGAALQDPPSVESHGGVLTVTLRVARTTYRVGGRAVDGLTYNGLLQPPTLVVNPGDTIKLRLVNQLPSAMEGMTNLHYHGL